MMNLNDDQKQYLIDLVERDLSDNRYHLQTLHMYGNGMTTSLDQDIKDTEKNVAMADSVLDLLTGNQA
jgi:hypothetical protein